ncbi:hypothetical protein QJQ45_015186, partial [Haematococcus lacustris]
MRDAEAGGRVAPSEVVQMEDAKRAAAEAQASIEDGSRTIAHTTTRAIAAATLTAQQAYATALDTIDHAQAFVLDATKPHISPWPCLQEYVDAGVRGYRDFEDAAVGTVQGEPGVSAQQPYQAGGLTVPTTSNTAAPHAMIITSSSSPHHQVLPGHSSSGRHLLSPMRCMFNAALQSRSSHLPGCGAGLALAALPWALPLPLVGSAAGLLRLAGGGVLGPGSEAAGCVAAWLLRGAWGGLRGATTGHHIMPRTGRSRCWLQAGRSRRGSTCPAGGFQPAGLVALSVFSSSSQGCLPFTAELTRLVRCSSTSTTLPRSWSVPLGLHTTLRQARSTASAPQPPPVPMVVPMPCDCHGGMWCTGLVAYSRERPLEAYTVFGTLALLSLPPTRQLLWRQTLGRLTNPQVVVQRNAEKVSRHLARSGQGQLQVGHVGQLVGHVGQLVGQVGLVGQIGQVQAGKTHLADYQVQMEKLEQRMQLGQEEMERGYAKLKATRVELQRLGRAVSASQQVATGVVQQLRAINKVDASLALRGESCGAAVLLPFNSIMPSLAALGSVSHRILTISMSHALHTGCSPSSCAEGGARAHYEERVPNRKPGHLTSDVDRPTTDHATSALLRVLGHVRNKPKPAPTRQATPTPTRKQARLVCNTSSSANSSSANTGSAGNSNGDDGSNDDGSASSEGWVGSKLAAGVAGYKKSTVGVVGKARAAAGLAGRT